MILISQLCWNVFYFSSSSRCYSRLLYHFIVTTESGEVGTPSDCDVCLYVTALEGWLKISAIRLSVLGIRYINIHAGKWWCKVVVLTIIHLAYDSEQYFSFGYLHIKKKLFGYCYEYYMFLNSIRTCHCWCLSVWCLVGRYLVCAKHAEEVTRWWVVKNWKILTACGWWWWLALLIMDLLMRFLYEVSNAIALGLIR